MCDSKEVIEAPCVKIKEGFSRADTRARDSTRARWRFIGDYRVSLDVGFELRMLYDVVYRAKDQRVVELGFAGLAWSTR